MLDIPVKNIVALVVDENHQRFGEFGKILSHDWQEYGRIDVEFSDGSREDFYDGIMKRDDLSKIKMYYRLHNEAGARYDEKELGPRSFKKKVLSMGKNDEENFNLKYKALFGEEFNF